MNLYENASLEHKLEELSDQAGLLLLDLLLAGLQKARSELLAFQEFSEAKVQSRNDHRPF